MGACHLAEGFPKLESGKEGKASFGVRATDYGVDEILDAFADASALAPQVLFGLLRADVSVEPFENSETDWTILFSYNREGWSQQTGGAFGEASQAEFEFDASYETTKITTALAQSAIGSAAPDFGLSLNVNEDGEVEGTEIPTPTLTFSETHFFQPSQLTPGFLNSLFVNIGKTNLNTFRGFDRGEVQYLGTRFKTKGREPIGLDMKFRASINLSNINAGTDTAGNTLTVPLKRAWEYMWKKCVKKKDSTKPALVPVPIGVYVATVVKEVNFSFLQIPQGDFQFGG